MDRLARNINWWDGQSVPPQRLREVGLDLEGARHTIDILDMLKAKCRTGTPEAVLKLLDQAVLENLAESDLEGDAAATERI